MGDPGPYGFRSATGLWWVQQRLSRWFPPRPIPRAGRYSVRAIFMSTQNLHRRTTPEATGSRPGSGAPPSQQMGSGHLTTVVSAG